MMIEVVPHKSVPLLRRHRAEKRVGLSGDARGARLYETADQLEELPSFFIKIVLPFHDEVFVGRRIPVERLAAGKALLRHRSDEHPEKTPFQFHVDRKSTRLN